MIPASVEGQTFGKYRILEPLGRGGMARVYRAYHPHLDRYVAVKVMRADLADDEEFLARFQREAQSVAGLRHPNIVQVHDFDMQDGVYYMVMELLGGDTLKTRLNDYRIRGEQMRLGEMVRIMLDVLDGLAYAHSEGMIHRDIKPGNILLSKRGQAVIADFGITYIIGGTRHTATGSLMGTPEYMAPEQGLKGRCDARSDLYSLGVVFYEMLTQRIPFGADTPLAILMKHVNDPLPLPRQINPEIPEALERVVLKSLAKKPEDRYQGAVKMAQALRQAAEEAGIELPARISLPLSFTTIESPSESVAVISGTTRRFLSDAEFADDETDVTLGKQLETQAEDEEAAAGRPDEAAPDEPTERGEALSNALLHGWALLGGVNSILVLGALLTNRWRVFGVGWPMEFFLVSVVLSMVMYATRAIKMLIPIGILSTLGLIFSYSSLANKWHHWSFLWVFLVWGIVGSVTIPRWLEQRGKATEDLCQAIAWAMGLIAALLALFVIIMSALGPILSLIAVGIVLVWAAARRWLPGLKKAT